MNFKVLFYFSTYFVALNGQKIEYLNGLFENEVCELENGSSGLCKKVTDCTQEYESYRNNKKNLRICIYGDESSQMIHQRRLFAVQK